MNRMPLVRVCIVSSGLPPHYGGAEIRAYRYADRLQDRNDVDAILVGWDQFNKRPVEDCLPKYVLPVNLRFRGFGDGRPIERLLGLVLHLGEIGLRLGPILFRLRHEIDVIHIINASRWFNLVAVLFARALGKPVILEMTLLGSDDPLTLSKREHQPKQQLFPHRPLKSVLFLKADAYVSKSHALSDAYRQAGLSETKLFQIFSGVDVQKYRPPGQEEKERLRDKLELKRGRPTILFVGGMNKRKGVHHLLAAFREVVTHQPQAYLVIVGPISKYDPAYVKCLHESAVTWGLADKTKFVHGLVENVAEYMRAADIFGFPSSREGLPMAVLEAMSSGLAVVASDIPEIARSQIEHGKEGLLVPVGDSHQFAGALLAVVRNAELRVQLGQAARQRILQEFSADVVDSQYIRLYRHLLHNQHSYDYMPPSPRSN